MFKKSVLLTVPIIHISGGHFSVTGNGLDGPSSFGHAAGVTNPTLSTRVASFPGIAE